MADLSKQLRKGALEILVLNLIAEEAQYGYVLLQELKERSGGFFELKEGTLYPILYRLEDAKWIESYWVEAEKRGLPKKYYRITKAGKRYAAESLALWNDFTYAVHKTLRRDSHVQENTD